MVIRVHDCKPKNQYMGIGSFETTHGNDLIVNAAWYIIVLSVFAQENFSFCFYFSHASWDGSRSLKSIRFPEPSDISWHHSSYYLTPRATLSFVKGFWKPFLQLKLLCFLSAPASNRYSSFFSIPCERMWPSILMTCLKELLDTRHFHLNAAPGQHGNTFILDLI